MRIVKASVQNFGSFKQLDFDFKDGLTLIHGSTGSGKSTIMDIVSWTLYGETSKNGGVDDVRSWGATEVTKGIVDVELPDGNIKVTRIRGTSAKQNDLYWEDEPGILRRGKDVTETTRLLEKRLNVSSNLYHSRAIYNDSSISGRFFTAKAKERRQLLEQVANLEFPVKLSEKLKEELKCVKKEYERVAQQYNTEIVKRDQLTQMLEDARVRSHTFDIDRQKAIDVTKKNLIGYTRANDTQVLYAQSKIAELEPKAKAEVCNHCGNEKVDKEIIWALAKLKADLSQRLEQPNPFIRELDRISTSQDPYYKQIDSLTLKIEMLTISQLYESTLQLKDLITSLEALQETSDTMRSLLLEQAITTLEQTTNQYLETYFNSELKISLVIDGPDSLNTGCRLGG